MKSEIELKKEVKEKILKLLNPTTNYLDCLCLFSDIRSMISLLGIQQINIALD